MNAVSLAALLFEAGRSRRWRRADCLARWPTAAVALERAGLLRGEGLAHTAPCAACGDTHEIELGEPPAMRCPVAGRVAVASHDLVEVAFDADRWLACVASGLQLQEPEAVIRGTLWRIPRQQRSGWRKQIWIARGLSVASTFDSVARTLKADGRRARWLLTSSDLPRDCGPALHAQVIRFSECADVSANGAVAIELERIVGARKKGRGVPGRRSKVGPALDLFRRRLADGMTAPILAEEARQIEAELARQQAPEARASARTIEDAIRDGHAAALGRARPAKS